MRNDCKGDANKGKKYWGKYRGKVTENEDPLFLGRIITEVPAVPGAVANWAMPCTPYAGFQVGFYTIPPIGANVWVEFEGGDPSFPIWAGCFWGEDEVPLGTPPAETKIFKTEFITMILNDEPDVGGFTLECIPPAVDVPLTMLFNSEGIKIICPEAIITMTPETISLVVPESAMVMSAEEVSVTVPPTTFTLTAETTESNSPSIELVADGDTTITAGAAIEIDAGADVEIGAGGAAEMTAGGDATIAAGAAAEMTAGADASVSAGGAAELAAGGDVAVAAAGAVEMAAVGDASISSITVLINGLTEVDGDLLMDGQQVLAI